MGKPMKHRVSFLREKMRGGIKIQTRSKTRIETQCETRNFSEGRENVTHIARYGTLMHACELSAQRYRCSCCTWEYTSLGRAGSKYEMKMGTHGMRLAYFPFSFFFCPANPWAIRVLCCDAFSIMRVTLWAADWKPLLCNYQRVSSRIYVLSLAL